MQNKSEQMNSLLIRAYTLWLENETDEVKNSLDYRELTEWFGKEVGIFLKQQYEN